MKPGPTLKGATRRPRARSAAMRPTATAVFPAPRPPPATTMQGGPSQGGATSEEAAPEVDPSGAESSEPPAARKKDAPGVS